MSLAVEHPAATLTASQLWLQAYGQAVPKSLKPWPTADTHCVMCGSPVRHGDPASKASDRIKESFNAKLECKYPGLAICGHCEGVWNPRWLGKLMDSRAVAIQGLGIFKLRTSEDLAAFILHPIPAPYVAIWNSRQQAHLIWRTPVAIPNDFVREVRLDDEMLVMDRRRLMASVEHWVKAHQILEALRQSKASLYELKWGLASTISGHPRNNLVQAVRQHSPEGAAHIAALDALTAAEWWGLLALRDVNLADPSTWPSLRPIDAAAPAVDADADEDEEEEE